MKVSNYLWFATFIAILLICFIACSKQKDPIQAGQMDVKTSDQSILPQTEPISEFNLDSTINRNVMGAWKVIIDTESLSAEIVPARNASAIGDIYDADLSQFLLVSPCHNCLRITKIAFDGYDDVLMKVAMKHPFDNITRRPDLHGFDVRAIFIIEHDAVDDYPDIEVMNPDGSTESALIDNAGENCYAQSPGGLLNADGYTSHFDWLPDDERYFIGGNSPSGNLNPFLRFFDDFATETFDPHSPSGYNVMPVGAGFFERTAVLSSDLFYNGGAEFYIVADVAYGHSAVLLNRDNPQYYLPSFNRTEAWRVEYWVENNNLHWSNPDSTADLVVQVFDWQHGHEVDPDYPDSSNLSGLRESSDVLQLELSIPGMQNDPIIVTTPESGTGTPQDPLQYRFTVTNQNGAQRGRMGILAIRDELHGQVQPSGRLAVPEAPAGFPYETVDIRDYTLYMPVIVNTENIMLLPSYKLGHIKGELGYHYEDLYAKGGSTIIAPDFFMDPSHRKFQYRWDYDYDGVTFNEDGSGLPSPEINSLRGGLHNVALRVRTNTKPPQQYIYELPVYSEGEAFRNTLPPQGSMKNVTSVTRGNSGAKSANGNYYLAFINESGGARNVKLAIIDREGNQNIINVTNSSNVNMYASVCVVDSGSAAGVYVAYTELHGSDQFIYVNRGNLDGSGFNTTAGVRISSIASGFETWPLITYFKNSLRVYYMHYLGGLISYKIYAAHSDNNGSSWVEDGAVLDNSSTLQYYPSLTNNSSDLYIAWTDGIDYDNEGFDLYMAKSTNGTSFTDYINLSPAKGKINYMYPSIDRFGLYTLVIAYLEIPDGSTDAKYLRAKVLNPQNGTIEDVVLDDYSSWFGDHIYMPVVGCASSNRFVVAYPKVSISGLDMLVYEHYRMEASYFTGWTKNLLFQKEMGVVETEIHDIYPVLVTTSPQPYVVENFIAWTDYTEGSSGTPSPVQYMGDIEMSYYITSRSHEDSF